MLKVSYSGNRRIKIALRSLSQQVHFVRSKCLHSKRTLLMLCNFNDTIGENYAAGVFTPPLENFKNAMIRFKNLSNIEIVVGMARILHNVFSPISDGRDDDWAIHWVLESPMERGSVSHEMKEYDVAKFEYYSSLNSTHFIS